MNDDLKFSGFSSWLRWSLVDKKHTCLRDFLERMQSLAGLFALFFLLLNTLLVDSSGTVAEVFPLLFIQILLWFSLGGCLFLICLTCLGMAVVFERLPGANADVSGWSLRKRIFLFCLALITVAMIVVCGMFGVIFVQKPF